MTPITPQHSLQFPYLLVQQRQLVVPPDELGAQDVPLVDHLVVLLALTQRLIVHAANGHLRGRKGGEREEVEKGRVEAVKARGGEKGADKGQRSEGREI